LPQQVRALLEDDHDVVQQRIAKNSNATSSSSSGRRLLQKRASIPDGIYRIRYAGEGPCQGKFLNYQRYGKKSPAKVNLASSSSRNPVLWQVKNVKGKSRQITLTAINRANCCPQRLGYARPRNCRRSQVDLGTRLNGLRWKFNGIRGIPNVYRFSAAIRSERCKGNKYLGRLAPTAADARRCGYPKNTITLASMRGSYNILWRMESVAPPPSPSPSLRPSPSPSPTPSPSPSPSPDPSPDDNACSITIDSVTTNFKKCIEMKDTANRPTGTAGFSLSTTSQNELIIGFKGLSSTAGWAALGYSPNGGMIGTDAVFAQNCGDTCVEGYSKALNGYAFQAFGQSKVDFSGINVGKDENGFLQGVAKMDWPGSQGSIAVVMASGPVGGGIPQIHFGVPKVVTLKKSDLE